MIARTVAGAQAAGIGRTDDVCLGEATETEREKSTP
jgi:hypothetical protein